MLWDEPKIFFLERRYFFSIILSEFLKNRVALQKEREKVMRSYMEGKKYRENKGESAIMEKMKKYIKFARGKIFFSFYEEKTETSRKFCRDVSA